MKEKERYFKEFYSKQFATSATFCTQFLNNRALGKDIAQEAFLRLWRKINDEEYDIQKIEMKNYAEQQLDGCDPRAKNGYLRLISAIKESL
ncbi:hypothetical protein [uncultured Bacteroides sp.]|uniref:hypothetical protein n=1 Tax=uncultured Bacteroides sp. TaxID=162156 RepID=UPI0025E4EBC6|nr:hypothetical protein [uncultured Bacteroides sp.]